MARRVASGRAEIVTSKPRRSVKNLAVRAGWLVRRLAEIEQAAQALVHPGPLLAAGLEIDLLGDHAHHHAELLAGHGREMAQHGGGVGAVLAGLAVERHFSGLGSKGNHRTEAVVGRRLVGHRLLVERCGAARFAQACITDRNGLGAGIEPHHCSRRKRVVAAGIEHDDDHRYLGFQFGNQAGNRHQLFAGVFERREVGIDRHDEVFAAGLDAVAGIIEHRDIGFFGVFGKTLEVALQALGVAVRTGRWCRSRAR